MKQPAQKTKRPEGPRLIPGAADFHGERILQEEVVEAEHEEGSRPQGDYEYQQMIAENSVFGPKQMIEEAAYFVAERRHFAPGHELADWLQAEQAVEASLCSAQGDSARGAV